MPSDLEGVVHALVRERSLCRRYNLAGRRGPIPLVLGRTIWAANSLSSALLPEAATALQSYRKPAAGKIRNSLTLSKQKEKREKTSKSKKKNTNQDDARKPLWRSESRHSVRPRRSGTRNRLSRAAKDGLPRLLIPTGLYPSRRLTPRFQ